MTMTDTLCKGPSADSSEEKIAFWHDPGKLAILHQILTLAGVALLSYYIISNTMANLNRQSIATGFGFLHRESSFEIGESLISYTAADSYARVLLVGALNTVMVSFIGIVLILILGTFIGIARLSSNWLVAKLSAGYIEVFQDIPVLLQLFFWYAFFYEMLPPTRQAWNPFSGVFLCNRGFIFAVPEANPIHKWMLVMFLAACAGAVLLRNWARRRQDRTGKAFPVFRTSLCLVIGLPLSAWLVGGAPTAMNAPVLSGFNFKGGVSVSPEFSALLIGLVLYTSAFVAEVVRAGIQSVSKGQTEAAMSIGLKPNRVLHLVILPQAMRVIIPPLTSQMLSLTKNSSLAVAIGFPDFVSVVGTTINQTGQAIEGVMLIMALYLIFSLGTSALMNWYNKKKAIVER
jgi:general L-amino acid transport system permease protein